MSEDRAPEPTREHLRISDAERHQVAEILRQAAGEGRLELDELDERLEATYAARTYADLVPITLDLPDGPSATAPVRLDKTPSSPSSSASSHPPSDLDAPPQRHFAVMGGVERRGAWTVPAEMMITAFMGGADLDMRQARFAAHECVITVNAIMGGATIVVGPDVDVVMEGVGIMGGYSGPNDREHVDLPRDAQVLRVRGVAIMGGVSVERKKPKPEPRDRRPHRWH